MSEPKNLNIVYSRGGDLAALIVVTNHHVHPIVTPAGVEKQTVTYPAPGDPTNVAAYEVDVPVEEKRRATPETDAECVQRMLAEGKLPFPAGTPHFICTTALPDVPTEQWRVSDWQNPSIIVVGMSAEALAAAKHSAVLAVTAFADQLAESLAGSVPQSEKLGWPGKRAAAKEVVNGTANAEEMALIAGEAAITGESAVALAQSILAKAVVYEQAVAAISGLRRATNAAIADPAVVAQSQIDGILDAAKVRAQQQLAALTGG